MSTEDQLIKLSNIVGGIAGMNPSSSASLAGWIEANAIRHLGDHGTLGDLTVAELCRQITAWQEMRHNLHATGNPYPAARIG